ncbi:MAG: hypothetical protein ACWA47_02725 [Brevirhabdus sp.]
MSERPGKIFLEQRPYRRRRLIDAARLLPVLGAVLVLAPALIGPTGEEASLARRGIYFFSIWLGLIVATWALARAIGKTERDEGGD